MKYILPACLLTVLMGCSPSAKFNRDKAAFDGSKVTMSFKSITDMNDTYFDIRENGFFEFYRQLFDSVKNTSYPGKYHMSGDTFHLAFYDKKGLEILGRKALVDQQKKEIIFFDHYPGVKKRLIFQ